MDPPSVLIPRTKRDLLRSIPASQDNPMLNGLAWVQTQYERFLQHYKEAPRSNGLDKAQTVYHEVVHDLALRVEEADRAGQFAISSGSSGSIMDRDIREVSICLGLCDDRLN